MLVAGIDVKQDTLQGHVLVESCIGLLLPSGGGQAQELGKDQQAVMQSLLSIGSSLLLHVVDSLGLLILVFLCQRLLKGGLLGSEACPVLLVDLLVLGDLLLDLGELGLELGLLETLGSLIGVDDLEADELVKGLVLVLGDYGVGSGGVGLGNGSVVEQQQP